MLSSERSVLVYWVGLVQMQLGVSKLTRLMTQRGCVVCVADAVNERRE